MLEVFTILGIAYIVVINLLAVVLTLHDKRAAKRNTRRVSEKTLLIVAALGGSVAMFLVMRAARHKTQHKKFMIGIPVIFVLQVALIIFLLRLTGGGEA